MTDAGVTPFMNDQTFFDEFPSSLILLAARPPDGYHHSHENHLDETRVDTVIRHDA